MRGMACAWLWFLISNGIYILKKRSHTLLTSVFFFNFISEAETISRDGAEEGMILAREAISELSFCSSI